MARKHIVFWGIIVFALSFIYIMFTINQPQIGLEDENKSPEKVFAEALESRYVEIDVLNIRRYINENEDFLLALYFDVLAPLSSTQLEVILLDMLQGLDGLADGSEDKYAIDYLYGNWRVGRTICPARYIIDIQSGLEVCQYIDISPPEYFGRIVIWEGR